MIIDAHQHVWDVERADHVRPTAGQDPIDRIMRIEDVLPAFVWVGITGDNDHDTNHRLEVAAEYEDLVLGDVAFVSPDCPPGEKESLRRVLDNPVVAGLRNPTHDQPLPDYLLGTVVDVFGTEHVMYGGDRSVSVLSGGYDRAWNGLAEILRTLSIEERERVLCGTALDLYWLGPEATSVVSDRLRS